MAINKKRASKEKITKAKPKKNDKKVKSKPKKINKKALIVKKYADLCNKLRRYPTMNEFSDTGITKDMVAHHHGSLGRLKVAARKKFPKKFKNILDDSIFNPRALQTLKTKIKDSKRFIITTAVTGCDVDKDFMKSIENYCNLNKAELLVLLASDPAAASNSDFVDPNIPRDSLVVSDVSLNSNIHLNTIKLSAKHIDPITSLTRIGQRDGGFVYASPKQRLKYIATDNDHTHAVMTTGAITAPNYTPKKYMSDRTAVIATHDHVMGAIIVEIEDDQKYHFRQIQADSDGNFVDLGKKYFPDTVIEYAPAAFILGDWHSGSTDTKVKDCWKDAAKTLKPNKIVIHDLADNLSINHHEEGAHALKVQRAEKGKLRLEAEIKKIIEDLNELNKWSDETVVVKSNHDEFLNRYLEDAKWPKDYPNARLAAKIFLQYLDNKDPLKSACEIVGGIKKPEKIRWLCRDENFSIARIHLGAHGDKGANGARGSIKGIEAAYGQSVTGHTHSPEILRGAWVVGTSSLLRLGYNEGASSWMHTACLVYPNGSRQLINVIGGKWRIK